MSAVIKSEDELTLLEHLTLRPYYLVTILTDTVQTVIKLAAVVFSFFIAAVCCGQLKTMNQWCIAHAEDTWISFKMTAFSVCGVIFPEFALRKREILDKHGVNELAKFDSKLINRANFFDRCGMRVQFVANAIKESFCVILCGIRYFLSVTLELINFRSGTAFSKINLHELVIFSGHLTFAFGSCQGVIFPHRVSKMMV